jgi:outer membrane protein assembly factor BamE (lipoprotein component of BamABCDE complex)
MSGSGCVFLAMLLVAPSASAESIFRCVEKSGEVVIRNFPCSPDSVSTEFKASTQTDVPNPKPGSAAAQRELRAGMSQSEVRAILGNPTNVTQEERADGNAYTWWYGGSRTVQFDVKGHLVK